MGQEKYPYITSSNLNLIDRFIYSIEAKKYLGRLGLRWSDLSNKKILEVGAGSALLALGAKRRNVDIAFMDIQPRYTVKTVTQKIARRTWKEYPLPQDQAEYMVADMMDQRFAERHQHSYDIIISHGANIGLSIRTQPILYQNFEQMLRENGEIRIYPAILNKGDVSISQEESDDLLQSFLPLCTVERCVVDKRNLRRTHLSNPFYYKIKKK